MNLREGILIGGSHVLTRKLLEGMNVTIIMTYNLSYQQLTLYPLSNMKT